MEDNLLTALPRKESGKGVARQIRRQGRVPGVFYYRGDENVPMSVSLSELNRLLRSRHSLIKVELEGQEPRECIIRELQRDPLDDTILHVDLMGIKHGQKLTVSIPVRLVEMPVGVKTGGGILEYGLPELKIECLPKDIQAVIEVDVSELNIGQSIHVSDLEFPALKFLDDPQTAVATVVPPTVVREVVEEVEEEVEAEEAEAPEEKEKHEKGEAPRKGEAHEKGGAPEKGKGKG